jgi:CubicO group peptidase (beta-lactamase class C family)
MEKTQFRVLYEQFLFRMVDIELLSADAKGDMSKLFGQFAALLVFIGVGLAWLGGLVGGAGLPPLAQLVAEWSGVHFVIATTMLVVGLFAILSWDSTFPDRRDVMVLAPLPIRPRTIFLAKVAAVATALSVTMAALQLFAGFIWPLSLNHRHEAVIVPPIAYDDAMAPLDVNAGLEQVLKHDLAPALGTGGGVAVGVWKHGARRVFAYGAAKPDSIFQIASITKTFTALALAQLVVQGKARLDEPVREFLPPGTVAQHEGLDITLLDLATHRSALPSIPANVHSTDPQNPLAGYSTADLYAFMKYWGAYRSPYATFSYSNLGFGLLGQALANRAGVSYADLLRGITGPLGMPDTVLNLSAEQKSRLMQGYSQLHSPVGLMDLGTLEGAGAIYSTAGDMVAYLAANLHPESVANAGTLPAALAASHQLRAAALPDLKIALAWMYDTKTGVYLHSGVALGYTSYAFFDPLGDDAAVVLLNQGPGYFSFADVIGEHIRERLAGQPAISLRTEEEPAGGGGILDFLRLFAAWWITMLMAGAFIYCCVLGAQGLAAQLLPRRHFLRVSSWLQLAAFGTFVAAYFLEPKLLMPDVIAASHGSPYLAWSPSYWFLGLFQQLNGSPALADLAQRAWIWSAVAFGATALAYTLAYLRTLRKIVEEPDIKPVAGGRSWVGQSKLPRFGSGFATAVRQFTIRTLLRSRQHRLILAFYMGLGFAFAILQRKADEAADTLGNTLSPAVLISTVVILILCVVGMRVVFSLPIDMRANWIFRITPIPAGPGCMTARRRALYTLSVVPVCLGAAALLFSIWPWQAAAKHLLVLVLLGSATAELCLHGRQKLPFACSYLPGKSNFNGTMLIWAFLLLTLMGEGTKLERESFDHAADYGVLVGALSVLAIAARWSAGRLAKSEEGHLQFEEAEEPEVFALDLHRDGVTPIATPGGPDA